MLSFAPHLPVGSRTMPPNPLFVIVRPGFERITTDGELIAEPGTIVPLVPVDLLPPWVAIEGVPRHLTPEQTTGMTNLGLYHRESEGYQLRFLHKGDKAAQHQVQEQVEDDTDTSTSSASEPSHMLTPPKQKPHVEEDKKIPVLQRPPPPPPRMPQGLSSSRHNPINQIQTPSPPPQPNLPKPKLSTTPQYCRHWCHHGTCKWGITCRFEHTMPTALDGLCSVGLPDIPIWWRAAMAAGMQTTAGGGLTAARKSEKKKRPKRLHMEGLRMVVEDGHGGPVLLGAREEGEDADDEGDGPAALAAARVTEENLIDV